MSDNDYYKRTKEFDPRTRANGLDVEFELDAISAAFDKIPAPREDGQGYDGPIHVGSATAPTHAVQLQQMEAQLGDNTENANRAEEAAERAEEARDIAIEKARQSGEARDEALEAAATITNIHREQLEKALGVNARVYPRLTNQNLKVGDVIPAPEDTADGLPITHVIVDGNAYAMSPLASGLVADLTATGATIGAVSVRFFDWRSFTSVSHMKSSTWLVEGQLVETQGRYSSGDGGHGKYIVTSEPVGRSVTSVALDNGLTAKLLHNGTVRLSQVGCRGVSADEDTPLYQGLVYEAAGFDPSLAPFATIKDFMAEIKDNKFAIIVDTKVKVYSLKYLPRTMVTGSPKGLRDFRNNENIGDFIEFVNLAPQTKGESCFSCDLSYWVPSYIPNSNEYVDCGPVHESTLIKITGKYKYMVDYRYVYGHKFNSNQFVGGGADFAFNYYDMFHFECKNNLGTATTGAIKAYRVTTGDVSGNYINQAGDKSEDTADYVLSNQIEVSSWGGVLKSQEKNTRALHLLSSTINLNDNVFEGWDIYRAQFSGNVVGAQTYVERIKKVISATVATSGEESYATISCPDAVLMEHTSLQGGTAKEAVIISLPLEAGWTSFKGFGKVNFTNNCKIKGTLSALSKCAQWDLLRWENHPKIEVVDGDGSAVFYVSPDGDDKNIGLLSSKPLKTMNELTHRVGCMLGELEFRFNGGNAYSFTNTVVMNLDGAKLTSYGSGKAIIDLSNGSSFTCRRIEASEIAFDNLVLLVKGNTARSVKSVLKGRQGELNRAVLTNVDLNFTNGYLIGDYSNEVYQWNFYLKGCTMPDNTDNGLNRNVPAASEKIILDAMIVSSNIEASGFVGDNLLSPRVAII